MKQYKKIDERTLEETEEKTTTETRRYTLIEIEERIAGLNSELEKLGALLKEAQNLGISY